MSLDVFSHTRLCTSKIIRRMSNGVCSATARVGVFNWGVVWSLWFRYGLELHWCNVCVSGVVPEAIKFDEKPMCVKIDL